MKTLLVLVSLIALGRCGENSVTINLKNAVNVINDKFISYEAKFSDLMELFMERKSLDHLNLMSPAYIKLQGFLNHLRNESDEKYQPSEVKALLQHLNTLKLSPVIVITYNIVSFEPLALLNDLKNARDLKMSNCVWQLGDNSVNLIDSFSIKKYSDDLRTLGILCDSVNKEHNLNWKVAADGSLLKVQGDKLQFNVVGYELSKLSSMDIITKSNSVATKSQIPSWVSIEQASSESFAEHTNQSQVEACDQECLMNGLLHAQVLGDAAGKGFNVLFFNESVATSPSKLEHSNAFKQAVSFLHKKLVGSKVFNVRVTKSSTDGKLSNLYSYCSKKTNGAITLMGINYSNMRSKFNVKLSTPMDNSAVILQYMLSASDGKVLLNNEKFNTEATPSYKFKKLSKQSIPLILPPFSMAFWTINNSKINECLSNVDDESKTDEVDKQLSSSTDELLRTLVANEFDGKRSNALERRTRNRRQLGASPSNSFLPGFELELPTFKFPTLKTSASNSMPIRDVFFNKNTDIYKVAPVDANPLQSSENPTLPKGDVFLLINDGKRRVGDGQHDYIIEDHGEKKRPTSNRRKPSSNKIIYKETTEAPDYFIPHDYIDATQKTSKKSSKKASKQDQPAEIGELFEAVRGQTYNGRSDQKSLGSNVELQTVIRELEPTYKQSKTALLAAKRKWDKQQIMELLQDAQLEEVDKEQLRDTDDFELIDLTDNNEGHNYEEYEQDDDGFFDDDELHHIRTRRNIDYTKNEIPKFGEHLVDDYEDSIESLVNDVHLYLPPRFESRADLDQKSSTKVLIATTEPPTAIKAIDYFTKSLNDAITVAHKTLIGWWYVFNTSEI